MGGLEHGTPKTGFLEGTSEVRVPWIGVCVFTVHVYVHTHTHTYKERNKKVYSPANTWKSKQGSTLKGYSVSFQFCLRKGKAYGGFIGLDPKAAWEYRSKPLNA